jgi:hypothetical protein
MDMIQSAERVGWGREVLKRLSFTSALTGFLSTGHLSGFVLLGGGGCLFLIFPSDSKDTDKRGA